MQHHISFASARFVISIAALAACTGPTTARTPTTTRWSARPATPTPPPTRPARRARPRAQAAHVELIVEGQGIVTGAPPTCADGLAGRFEALSRGELAIADDGVYPGGFGSAAAALTTPSGCQLPELDVQVITRVTARAQLEATTRNCAAYCEADARATAGASCAGQADQASCRSQAEATASASCTTMCTTRAHAIAAEVSIGVGTLGTLDAEALCAAELGQLTADLTFDHLVDGQGQRVGD